MGYQGTETPHRVFTLLDDDGFEHSETIVADSIVLAANTFARDNAPEEIPIFAVEGDSFTVKGSRLFFVYENRDGRAHPIDIRYLVGAHHAV